MDHNQNILEPASTGSRIIPKPTWVKHLEATLGALIPLSPNVISALKLLLVLPLLAGLRQVGLLPPSPWLTLPLFGLYLALDYLDGVVAREQGKATAFGRIFDRLTDLPLLIPLAIFCCHALPRAPVLLKLGLDLALLVLFCAGRGPVENRVRTILSSATLLVMLLVSQGWAPQAGVGVAVALLLLNAAFDAVVVIVRLRLQKRFIADALSAGNLLCGAGSIAFALTGRFEPCLLLLAGSLALDGMDGAAARRWGGTRWGVYSDDVADAVSYGLAPGVLLACALGGGVVGWSVGGAYALFTVTRLLYFTASKAGSDPAHFAGMPSPAGAVLVICAVLVFSAWPVLVGLLAGAACVLMVSFDAPYRHLGRLLGELSGRRHKARLGLAAAGTLALLALVGAYALWGIAAPASLVLTAVLAFALQRPARELVRALWSWRLTDASVPTDNQDLHGLSLQTRRSPRNSRCGAADSGGRARLHRGQPLAAGASLLRRRGLRPGPRLRERQVRSRGGRS
jgi:CDP-diacylglycerol---serine O-phosphatidyltransferase